MFYLQGFVFKGANLGAKVYLVYVVYLWYKYGKKILENLIIFYNYSNKAMLSRSDYQFSSSKITISEYIYTIIVQICNK